MSEDRIYTVSQLSRLAGVSVRTLHYYDQIGLLKPVRREDNGFREYHSEHLVLLQQILLYRELDLSTDQIREILSSNHYDLLEVFNNQKHLLRERIRKAQLMINRIEETMENVRGKLNQEIMFGDIPKEKIERWDSIRRDKVTSTVSESMAQVLGKLSEHDAKHFRERSERFHEAYIDLLDLPVESVKVQECIRQHYEIMNGVLYRIYDDFKGIGYRGYLQLASQILSDEVTGEIHEHYSQGMAEHLNKAMVHFAENTLKDNLDKIRKRGLDGKL